MKSVVVIPARYKSSRFPGKPLVSLLNKPMILWVAELSAKAVGKENVYIATDDNRIVEVVESAGFNSVMTSEHCLTGTDRLAEAALKIDADFIINVQGDEPMIDYRDISAVIALKEKYPDEIINCYCSLSPEESQENVNIPKVVFTEDGRLVYMSRQAIPGYKDSDCQPDQFYKQVCIYGFNKTDLRNYSEFGRKSTLELSEDIEIIRFLEWGQTIRMLETQSGSLAVDVPDDVAKVEAELKKVMQT